MDNNFQELDITSQDIIDACVSDYVKINNHLTELYEEQSKSQNKQFAITLIFTILTFLVSVSSLVIGILQLLI